MSRQALLIGIEYIDTPNALPGCHRDVDNVHQLLMSSLNYKTHNITIVTEKSDIQPTRDNILQQIDILIKKCIQESSDQALLYFSCHGNQIRDQNEDELTTDRLDEVLVPLDYDISGFIRDDELVKYLSRFPKSCPCIAIFDSCNSGTMADLPYSFDYNPTNKTCIPLLQNAIEINNTVISISGCKDKQTSSLVYNNNQWNSALTSALIGIFQRTREIMTFFQLQSQLVDYMIKNNLSQRPVVSSSWNARPGTLILSKQPNRPKPHTGETQALQRYIQTDPIYRRDVSSYWNLAFG